LFWFSFSIFLHLVVPSFHFFFAFAPPLFFVFSFSVFWLGGGLVWLGIGEPLFLVLVDGGGSLAASFLCFIFRRVALWVLRIWSHDLWWCWVAGSIRNLHGWFSGCTMVLVLGVASSVVMCSGNAAAW
jgi:hypothetical protein